ncbi:MAG: EamA family transporter [Candidatus Buchananbacteria bacterium]|jgi:uncharacterized membrane protein
MLWLPIAILSYALNAGSLVTDKFLLLKKVTRPAVFTMIICLMGILAVVLLPFGWQIPTSYELFLEISAGVIFALALLLMFVALDKGESSRVVPFLNGLQPIFLLPMAWLWLDEKVTEKFLIAFILIVAGSVLITWGKGKAKRQAYVWAIISAFLFAFSIALSKMAFNSADTFITPFVMTRIGSAIFALALIFWPKNIKMLKEELKKPSETSIWLVIGGQIAGASSSLLYNLAIAISVNATALVNALQGMQYVFLLIIVTVMSKLNPKALNEKMIRKILAQKIIATALIIAGLAVMAL